MFSKESLWIQEQIHSLHLEKGSTVLDIGSSSPTYRDQKQPHIGKLYEWLMDKGFVLYTLDIDPATHASFVVNIAGTDVPKIGPFDLVLATNILEHIEPQQLDQAINNITTLVSRNLLVTCPNFYPWHFQPIDNGLRPTAEELSVLFSPAFKAKQRALWEDEHYAEPYKSMKNFPKPWVSGVLLEKK